MARKVPLRKKRGQWYVRIQRGGADSMYPTGTGVRKEAEALGEGIVGLFDREKTARRIARDLCRYAMAIAREEMEHKDIQGPLQALEAVAAREALEVMSQVFPDVGMTAQVAWMRYEEGDTKGVKESTMKARRMRWEHFSRWAKGRDLKAMTASDARAYLQSMKCSGQTWNNAVGDCGTVFRGAGLPDIWSQLRQKSVSHAERASLDMDILRILLEYLDHHASKEYNGIPAADWADYARSLYYSGLRPSDVCGLQLSDIREGRVELVPEKTSRTRKKVSYVADPSLMEILRRRGSDGAGYFFPKMHELFQRDKTAFQHALGRMLRDAELPAGSFTWYQLRANFVTQQVRSGEDIQDVAAAVGHVSEETTKEHYYHGKVGVELSRMPKV